MNNTSELALGMEEEFFLHALGNLCVSSGLGATVIKFTYDISLVSLPEIYNKTK